MQKSEHVDTALPVFPVFLSCCLVSSVGQVGQGILEGAEVRLYLHYVNDVSWYFSLTLFIFLCSSSLLFIWFFFYSRLHSFSLKLGWIQLIWAILVLLLFSILALSVYSELPDSFQDPSYLFTSFAKSNACLCSRLSLILAVREPVC